MKKKLLFLSMLLLPMAASADAVEIDGIYYNLYSDFWSGTPTTAEVTSSPNKYTGNVVIPASVTYDGAEYSVTSIGNYAFRKCSDLTSVTIPNSVTTIGDRAFENCTSLNSVTIGNSVTTIDYGAFSGCSGLIFVIIPNSVTSIDEKAFYNCTSLTSVTIGNSVTSINKYTFSGCSALTSITIGNSVTSIGEEAFSNCSGLTSITIPNSVTTINEYAFWDCSSLTSITIGNGVTSIGNYAFNNCSGLTSVHISDIAAWCKISFGDSSNPLYYARHLYLEEEEIKDLVIPNSVTTIGDQAFSGCQSLNSVTIPNSVTTIGNEAFASCYGLISITIPNSVTTIGDYAFSGCQSLNSVTIPNSVKKIGEWAFDGCWGLASVNIPNSVTTIGKGAFYLCRYLRSVTIGEGIESIGSEAFAYSEVMTDVYCYAKKVPTTETNAFNYYTENATLHVPKSSINSYQAAEPWSKFKSIVAIDENSGITNMTVQPILIQNDGGIVSIQGTDDLTPISVYNINGTLLGSAVSHNGTATISTSLQPGSVAIIKIGDRSIKAVIR